MFFRGLSLLQNRKIKPLPGAIFTKHIIVFEWLFTGRYRGYTEKRASIRKSSCRPKQQMRLQRKKGEGPEVKMAVPLLQWIACSAVISALLVGLDSAMIRGRLLLSHSAPTTSCRHSWLKCYQIAICLLRKNETNGKWKATC